MANPSVHYLGVVGTAGRSDHSKCAAQWEALKRARSSEYGPDGAYNFGACIHGERFEGRGWDRDSAANGVENGVNHNPGSRAICAMVGTDDDITAELEECIAEFAREAVEEHGMAYPLRPHSFYVATSCPGDHLRQTIRQFNAGELSAAVEDDMRTDEFDARINLLTAPGQKDGYQTLKAILPTLQQLFNEVAALRKEVAELKK